MSKQEEIQLLSPMEAVHKYASELTAKVRELDQLEQEYSIVPGQATEILSQMIENYLYTIFQTMLKSQYTQREDKEAAFKAMTILQEHKHLLASPPHIPSN